ncbi:unnamed protein product [Urochloa decumbens]|uniref:Cathepsin propeptide inhibitor domain-containing protein n=1 Tax=Urochloa decumbens TaxID=240449 RepID=A0ABC9DRQ9_9POAL
MRGFTVLLAALLLLLEPLEAADMSTISYEEETRRMFVEWKAKYGKTYKDVGEEECRYAVFKDSRRRLADHPNAADAGVSSYAPNQFGDLTHEEARAYCYGRGFRIGEKSYEEETRLMFVEWKAKYGKTYKDVGEEECRYALFKGNRRVIVQLNAAADAGETSYGLNQFGDLTKEEVRACCYGRGVLNNLESEGKLSARCQVAAAALDPPYSVDSRKKGAEAKVQLSRSQVCRCIATELKQSLEVAPFLEMKHMWI